MSHTAYALSPCGGFAAAGQGAQVLLWDAISVPPILVLGNPYRTAISVVSWSSNGRLLLAGSCDGAILAWEIARGELRLSGRLPFVFAAVVEVACSPPPWSIIAGLHANGQIQAWNARTGKLVYQAMSPGATSLMWSPDGRCLATNAGGCWHISVVEGD